MKRHALEDAVSADLVPVEVVLNSLKQRILTIIKANKQANKLLKYLLFLGGNVGLVWGGTVHIGI